MNWFTKNTNVIVDSRDDRCAHLKDGDKAAFRTAEMDSFGPVGRMCYCEACYQDYLKNTTTQNKVGGDYILDAVKAAVKAFVRRYEEPSEAEVKFASALETAEAVGIQLQEEVEPPYEWEGPDAKGRLYYRPVFRLATDGQITDELVGADTIWNTLTHTDSEFLCRLGEQLASYMPAVNFDAPGGAWQLSPHVGYMVSANGVFDFNGKLVAHYTWNDKKPEKIEIRPLGDYQYETCYDCKQEKFKYLTSEWKWYDFYAPQGDEPLCICDACWDAPRHKERRRKDQAAYNAEMGHDDQDDGYDYSPGEEPEIFDESDVVEAVVAEVPAAVSFKSANDLSATLEVATEYLQRRQDDLVKLKVMLWDNQNAIAPGWELRRYTDGDICICSVADGDVDWAKQFASVEQALAYILARWW